MLINLHWIKTEEVLRSIKDQESVSNWKMEDLWIVPQKVQSSWTTATQSGYTLQRQKTWVLVAMWSRIAAAPKAGSNSQFCNHVSLTAYCLTWGKRSKGAAFGPPAGTAPWAGAAGAVPGAPAGNAAGWRDTGGASSAASGIPCMHYSSENT